MDTMKVGIIGTSKCADIVHISAMRTEFKRAPPAKVQNDSIDGTSLHKEEMMYRTIILVFVFTFFASFTYAGSSKVEIDDAAWPRWRGQNGDGIWVGANWEPDALAEGVKILWRAKIEPGHSNVVIANNRLFTMGGSRKAGTYMYCFNARTGKEIWTYKFEKSEITRSTPIVDGEYVYGLDLHGVLVCLKVKNGKLQWEIDFVDDYEVIEPNYKFATSPVMVGDQLILNLNRTGMALNKVTGEIVWKSDPSHASYYATPVVYESEGQNNVLFATWAGLHSARSQTGERLWSFDWNSEICADPVFFHNRVMISSFGECILFDVTEKKPEILWRNRNLRNHISTSVYLDGYLYGSNGDIRNKERVSFRCIDAQNGNIQWEQDIGISSLIAADRKLIILEEDGTLRIAAANPTSYQEICRIDVLGGEETDKRLFWTPPVLYEGRLYCRSFFGDLICIDAEKNDQISKSADIPSCAWRLARWQLH